MSYHFSKRLERPFNEVVAAVKEKLAEHGFGALTEIDVESTLKKKIDADFRPYLILGACSPRHAHQALLAEPHIGIMLPCNVVVQEHEDGVVEVSAIDPVASMQAVDNPALGEIAPEIRDKLKAVVETL